jgi:ketosteroid isomerase-like protein
MNSERRSLSELDIGLLARNWVRRGDMLRIIPGRLNMVARATFLKALATLAITLALPATADDFEDMVAAERAFAADASTRSTREAFVAALADDGLVFAPGPTSGKRVWESRPVDKNKLEWAPAVAEIASSGDLGYTSGPWRFTPDGAGKPSASGQFFTVWKKQADGKWKLVIDHGVSGPAAAFPEKVQRRGGMGVGSTPNRTVGVAELRTADLAPAGALNPRMVSADFLRLRDGKAPDGRAEGQAFPTSASRVDTGLIISSSGDLAATWGGGAGGPTWLRIWRRPSIEDAPGGSWQLAVDLAVPAPGPAE